MPSRTRAQAARLAAAATAIPDYDLDLRLTRGRCLRRRCGSRWAVTRVTIDFRPDTIERTATLECAECGRVWRRVAVPASTPDRPALRTARGQTCRVTAILPASAHRWRSRGRWHRSGDDALILTDASAGDLSDAARDHRERVSRKFATRERARERREAADLAAVEAARSLLARIHAREEAARAAEAEAAAREAA